ncbi:hypothetical protein CERZMDRAFT_118817 [Cercospora zeae-maydis SCOH1-5]|uniref:Polyketide cyclase n=1 Tax=Cercospora zeae-maydis SCOH1-5 TaxID=717836 RepID=A0A6A6F551_9PEZI|nr:hypothetical protein CERZMDRAFT_118817 [Cercospora zeae-maydis SCOH1-5]
MGRITIESETAFARPAEEIYDFVSNPANWGRTYQGSGGLHNNAQLKLPLQFGDQWTEAVPLAENTYVATWTLITAMRPHKWVFQQVDGIGAHAEGKGESRGVPGTTTISYFFEPQVGPHEGTTLFRRKIEYDLPKGVDLAPDLLVASGPGGIDRYHAAIERVMREDAEKK